MQGPASLYLHPQSLVQLWCSACTPLIPESLRQLGIGACLALSSLWAWDSPCPEGSQESWFHHQCGSADGRALEEEEGTASLGSALEEGL